MRRYRDPRATFYFILIGTALILLLEFAFWPAEKSKPITAMDELLKQDELGQVFESESAVGGFDILSKEEGSEESSEYAYEEHGDLAHTGEGEEKKEYETTALINEVALPKVIDAPVPTKVYNLPPDEKPKIVIIIDDMGLDQRRSKLVMDIKAPLTLAFIPYAEGLAEQTKYASAQGHELMIHVPMEPMNERLDPGPIALLDEMDEEQVHEVMEKVFNSFEGYVGINNHMGSKLTQNSEIMAWVMEDLQKRGLLFVDSKTIGASVAGDMADRYHLDHIDRDVFLDHINTDEFVASSLEKLERVALAKGYAVAIGHPKDVTIKGLKEWLPSLEEKGFKLVTVSAIAQEMKEEKPNKVAASKLHKKEKTPEKKIKAKKETLTDPKEAVKDKGEALSVDALLKPHLQ